jgi:hypothetical protein
VTRQQGRCGRRITLQDAVQKLVGVHGQKKLEARLAEENPATAATICRKFWRKSQKSSNRRRKQQKYRRDEFAPMI